MGNKYYFIDSGNDATIKDFKPKTEELLHFNYSLKENCIYEVFKIHNTSNKIIDFMIDDNFKIITILNDFFYYKKLISSKTIISNRKLLKHGK